VPVSVPFTLRLTIGGVPRRTPIRELHVAFKILPFIILLQNYAGSKQESYRITTMQMLVT